MPAGPPGFSEWLTTLLQPAVIPVGVGLMLNQPGKRIDDLREDRKETRKDIKDIKDIKELRDEVKGLPLKIMEMLRKASH